MSDTVIGLLACGVSSLFFGSMFVPVRKFNAGDGIIVQFIMCTAIFGVGLIVYFVRGFPQFQPFAMLGGLGWAIGNLTAMPIIDRIGLGLGVLIWGSVNCVVGWAVGRFGLFGTNPSVPDHQIMNYAGLIFVVVGGALFSQVKTNGEKVKSLSVSSDENVEANTDPQSTSVAIAQTEAEQHLLASEQNSPAIPTDHQSTEAQVDQEEITPTVRKSSTAKLIGIALSVIAGLCYGTTFVPVIHIQDNPDKFVNPSKHGIDYILSHYTGIYLTSISVLIIYIIYKRNKPYVDPQIIGPSLLAGLLWSIAQMAWFVANDCLSQAVTFPINAMVPGVCATLWSVFFFKEITGRRNMQLLVVAIAITLTGAALVGLSR